MVMVAALPGGGIERAARNAESIRSAATSGGCWGSGFVPVFTKTPEGKFVQSDPLRRHDIPMPPAWSITQQPKIRRARKLVCEIWYFFEDETFRSHRPIRPKRSGVKDNGHNPRNAP